MLSGLWVDSEGGELGDLVSGVASLAISRSGTEGMAMVRSRVGPVLAASAIAFIASDRVPIGWKRLLRVREGEIGGMQEVLRAMKGVLLSGSDVDDGM